MELGLRDGKLREVPKAGETSQLPQEPAQPSFWENMEKKVNQRCWRCSKYAMAQIIPAKAAF